MNVTVVTAAIIIEKGKVLVAQRKPGKNEELKWEFPGGKLEEGETLEKCLAREIKEELNIDIEVEEVFDVVSHQYQKEKILLLAYKCKYIDGEVEAIDCNDYQWVELKHLKDLDFAKADIELVEKLVKQKE